MYNPKLDSNQVKKLYYLREYQKAQGQKSTMTGLVREAVGQYLDKHNEDIKKGNSLITERELKQARLEKEYTKKKIEIAKSRIYPEKLALIEKFILTDKKL